MAVSVRPQASRVPQKQPKKKSDIKVRSLSGFLYIAISVICILLGEIPTLLMVMAVAGICAGEFYYMLRADAKLPNEIVGIIAAVVYPLAVFLYGVNGAMVVTLIQLLALLVWYVFWMRARIADVGISFLGSTYMGLLLSGIIVIREGFYDYWGNIFILLFFMSVWGTDVFAYLFGRKFGKHKMAPRISPKKSWEGLIAGLLCSVLFWIVMSFIPGVYMDIFQAIVFGIIVGAAGVLGDLLESRIKRNSGFKDSGTLLPGHGGLFDRCDSLFLASITAMILLIWFNCIPTTIF